ncbi:hypothetical protein [Streptomyces canus]|uniref:hypothetical protein n=1 Tax=Streptomyces canus TaxID=58343 RepID=UPI0036F0953B
MPHFRTPRACVYCNENAREYRLYGLGEEMRANRAIPTCGTIPCAIRADHSASNTGKHYYCTTTIQDGVTPI